MDDLIERRGSVDLLKIDAEGAEWSCLFMLRLLGRRIVGEYHLAATADLLYRVEWHEIGVDALHRRLEAAGFVVEIDASGDGGTGHFWAARA